MRKRLDLEYETSSPRTPPSRGQKSSLQPKYGIICTTQKMLNGA